MVLTRLKNASVIHGFHEEKVFVRMAIMRADTPGGAVSAANFDGAEEEVQVNLAVELLPPKVKPQPMHPDFYDGPACEQSLVSCRQT